MLSRGRGDEKEGGFFEEEVSPKDWALEDTQGRRGFCKRGLLDQDSRISLGTINHGAADGCLHQTDPTPSSISKPEHKRQAHHIGMLLTDHLAWSCEGRSKEYVHDDVGIERQADAAPLTGYLQI